MLSASTKVWKEISPLGRDSPEYALFIVKICLIQNDILCRKNILMIMGTKSNLHSYQMKTSAVTFSRSPLTTQVTWLIISRNILISISIIYWEGITWQWLSWESGSSNKYEKYLKKKKTYRLTMIQFSCNFIIIW
jgi:hypothetical protein